MFTLLRYWYQHRLKHSPYRHLFTKPSKGRAIALDCEATSLDPKKAELVSIAAIPIVGDQMLTSQSLYLTLSPPEGLDKHSVVVHQLRHHDLHQGECVEAALKRLIDFIGNSPLVGYHIRYDRTILNRYSQQLLGFPLPNQVIDVADLYHNYYRPRQPEVPLDLSLSAISKRLTLPQLANHNAKQDAIQAGLIYLQLSTKLGRAD